MFPENVFPDNFRPPHQHRGEKGERRLMEGLVLEGNKADGSALANLIQLLVDEYGLTDETT